jgi:hypothetical protein
MSKRESIQQGRLEKLESEFLLLLPRILKQCAAGRWGLFGQNDHFEESSYLHWPEAEQLKDMAREIHSIREDFGESNPQVERFLHYCSLRGPNVPGEPKLAQSLLDGTHISGAMGPQ